MCQLLGRYHPEVGNPLVSVFCFTFCKVSVAQFGKYVGSQAVGAVSQDLAAPAFLELLTRTLAQGIAKPTRKLRLLRILCPFWTQVYSVLLFQKWMYTGHAS